MSKSKNEVRLEAIQLCRELRQRETNAERCFWEAVRNRQFMDLKFFRQYPFFHEEDGSFRYYVADFYCRERKIVVELDGRSHVSKSEYDIDRTKILEASGVRVLRFQNETVENNLGGVLQELKRLLETKLIPHPPSLVREGGDPLGG